MPGDFLLCNYSAAQEPILNRELETACGLPLRWFDVLVQLHATPHKRLSVTELASAALLSKRGLTRLGRSHRGGGTRGASRGARRQSTRTGPEATLTPISRRRAVHTGD